jgi:Tfp pilus assembly protein PilN
MRKLQIDFAPPSLRRSLFHLAPATWIGLAAGLALCFGAALTAGQLAQQRQARAELVQRQSQHQARLTHVPTPVAHTPIPTAQAQAVNAAIGQLNLPWRDLQDALAAATPTNVALLALEPDAKKRQLKLRGEAKSSDDMVAYIEALKAQEFFSDVVLMKHEINDQDPNRPIRFQLAASWSGGGL